MTITKVFGIREEDFYQFIKKINQFYEKHKATATQTFLDKNNYFCAIIYFESEAKK